MPKKAKELSALEVKRLTTPGRHATGNVAGLLLVVKESGAKSWILRTVIAGKRRNIGLGGYPEISLAQAREKARNIKDQIEQGIDPVEQKRATRRALAKQQTEKMTFSKAAQLCHEKKSSEFSNEKHKKDWIRSIETYANPVIGDMPIDEIELPHILKIFEPIWQERTETATRLRQRVETVLTWATVAGHRTGDNPARWKGHLEAILPKPTKIKKTSHFKALPWQEIGAFMQELRNRDGMGARALEFIVLTAKRSGEVRLATWEEIDFENKAWSIPGERMKNGKPHTVPLTDDAIKLLKALPRFEGSPYVFPAARGGPLSDMTISAVCKRMKVDAVPHGFRSTFRDWAAENTSFPREVCEQALAHTIENKVEAAYRRGDLFEKRRRLKDAWASFCNKVQKDNKAIVTSILKGENEYIKK